MRTLTFLLFLAAISFPSFSQTPFTTGSAAYYTIVGAFAIKDNAARFNKALRRKGMASSYGYLPSNNIYYVYTTKNRDKSVCVKQMQELRKKPEFWDAWVRYIGEENTGRNNPEIQINAPILETGVATIESAGSNVPEVVKEEVPVEEADERLTQPDGITVGNTEIFLSLYNSRTDKEVEGIVQVVDTDRGRLIEEVKGNTHLTLPNPKNKSGKVTLVADVVGYRKIQREINFNNPLADTSVVTQTETSIVMDFPMVRYQKGDIRTLYNIYFYNDAAVMMPESKFELNQLLNMMQENPDYRIKLHGHTNGSYHGKIIKVGEGGDFFSVAKEAKTTTGSAKELSESRAGVIRDWLVANGVEASRIEVKAWGGKRPLYDKNGANAKKNIRVEVEIIDD